MLRNVAGGSLRSGAWVSTCRLRPLRAFVATSTRRRRPPALTHDIGLRLRSPSWRSLSDLAQSAVTLAFSSPEQQWPRKDGPSRWADGDRVGYFSQYMAMIITFIVR